MPLLGTMVGNTVNIDPLYDGVVMFSPSTIFFNDAQPRPDGRKIYHVFEQNAEGNTVDNIADTAKDFEMKKKELFAKATEDNLQNIHQIFTKNGIWMQEWSQFPLIYGSVVTVISPHILLTTIPFSKLSISETPKTSPQPIQNVQIPPDEENHENYVEYHHFNIFKIFQFYMEYPPEIKSYQNKLLRRLQRRGIMDVEFEPENLRVTIKTKRPAHIVLRLLKKFDPNVFLLSTTHNVAISSENFEDVEINQHDDGL